MFSPTSNPKPNVSNTLAKQGMFSTSNNGFKMWMTHFPSTKLFTPYPALNFAPVNFEKIKSHWGFSVFWTSATQRGANTHYSDKKEKKNQLAGVKKCELSYPEPNYLESGCPKSNQAKPMHRGITQKEKRKRHSYIKRQLVRNPVKCGRL